MSNWVRRRLLPRTDERSSEQVASREDIIACFRLILGRDANPEEVPGHMLQVGQPLGRVVAGYVNSLEFARRGLLRLEADAPTLVQLDGYQLYASLDDAAVGRHIVGGNYEMEVTAVFRRLIKVGMSVIDLGANVGYFTMLAGHLVGPDGYVLAVEPNPDNVRLLEASRQLNGFEHVSVAQVAAGRQVGVLMLNATHSNGTTAPMGQGLEAVLLARTVSCVPLAALLPAERRIDVIKIDVEGAEYNALLGAEGMLARDRPAVISEFSPGLLPGISGIDGRGYLAWLFGLGYDVAVINPDGSVGQAGRDAGAVMAAYERRGTEHIDLLATAS